jgi:hypothetical protein
MSQRDAVFDRHSADRNERQYVSRPNARMLAPVRSQVDQCGSGCNCSQCAVNDRPRRGNKRDYGPIVIRIDMTIQNGHAVYRRNRLRDGFNDFGLAAFTEVWYTLDKTIADCGLLIAD